MLIYYRIINAFDFVEKSFSFSIKPEKYKREISVVSISQPQSQNGFRVS